MMGKIFYERPHVVGKNVERQEVSSWGFGHVKELEERRRRDNYLMREIFYSGQMELVL